MTIKCMECFTRRNTPPISTLFVFLLLLFPPSLFLGQKKENIRVTAYPSHFSFTVDKDTFAELRASNFLLNEFAGTTIKSLTVDSGISWIGVYILVGIII